MTPLANMWSDLAASFTATPPSVAALRMIAALILGGAIGFEREWHHKPAGLRTHMLIAIASALFALIAFELVDITRAEGPESGARSDLTRLISSVTSGVAFLAAGTIIISGQRVKGLTTGAGMWLAGAVGLACGCGRIGLAGLATLLTLLVLWIFRKIEARVDKLEEEIERKHPDPDFEAPLRNDPISKTRHRTVSDE
ncbi:MgtC/SapB family protein [Paenirhodobacter enshiensis]|uniref:MgtC/SapB family protein n=1 Tax=Paenirhodobacter enshiensis TaxID=1105367 RepID=UPI0035AD9643